MKFKTLAAMILMAVTVLSGCTPNRQNEEAGTVIGAVVGGILGSTLGKGSGKAAAIMVGTVAGAIIGGRVGQSMDANDRAQTSHVLETGRDDQPSSWRNPNSGYEYTVVPTKTIEYETGPCREYVMKAKIGGKKENIYGTACRQPDGSWKTEG